MTKLVVIPAYNEEKNLHSVLPDVKRYLPEFDVVVVNDGSKDRTAETAVSLGAGVISHPVNIGYGAAVQTGFKYAARKGYDVVVIMDADGQHDAADAPGLLRVLDESGADMVIASRFLGRTPYRSTFARFLGRYLFSTITRLLTGKIFTDITSGYQALNRRAVAHLSVNYPVDFPDAEVIIMMLLCGFKVAEAPATFRERHTGISMFSVPMKLYYPFKGVLAVLSVVLRHRLNKEGMPCR